MTNIIYIYKTINKKNWYKRRIKESQECYIITKKKIRHWNVPTLSFSFLLHFLHFFLTFSLSFFFLYSQIFSSPLFGSIFSLLKNSPLSFFFSPPCLFFLFSTIWLPPFLSSRTLPSLFFLSSLSFFPLLHNLAPSHSFSPTSYSYLYSLLAPFFFFFFFMIH